MRYAKNESILLNSGMLWGLYTGLTSAFVTAFALALGAPNTVIGILGALPWIANVLAQIPGAQILEFASRKRVYLIATGLSRIMWLFIILLPYFFIHNPYFYLVVFVFFMKFSDFTADPAWLSLYADVVHKKHQARFSADRSILIGIAHMAASLLAGWYLDLFSKQDFTGFSTIFSVGLLFGLATTFSMVRIKEPAYSDHDHHPVKEFFTIRGDFLKFCMFALYFHFAWQFASPFFAVYLLKNLEFTYTFFVIAMSVTTVSKLISHYHYGKLIDRFGDKTVLTFGVLGTALVPFSYLFLTQANAWLVIPIHILSGFVWAGTDLALFNMLLDYSDKEHRALQVAEYSMISALPMIAAPILGGLVADYGSFVFSGISLVFAISVILRAGSAFLVLRLKEPRARKAYPPLYVFKRMIGLRPIEGFEHVVKVVRKKFSRT